MALIRWNLGRDLTWSDMLPDLSQMHREINRLFNSSVGGRLDDGSFGSILTPAVDIAEHEEAYVVEAEIPGLTKDDVKISVEGNVLTIRGEKKQEKTKEGKNYHRSERAYGSFLRSFTLPTSVKTDKIEARYTNGVLTVTVPKVEEAKPKAIDVKVQ